MTRTEYLSNPYPHAKRGLDLPHARLTPALIREIRANRRGEAQKQGWHLVRADTWLRRQALKLFGIA